MTSAIFMDVSRNYYVYETTTQPMLNTLAKCHASIFICYLILARLCDPP